MVIVLGSAVGILSFCLSSSVPFLKEQDDHDDDEVTDLVLRLPGQQVMTKRDAGNNNTQVTAEGPLHRRARPKL